jgi:thiosulfate reductase cytochrome b subunit
VTDVGQPILVAGAILLACLLAYRVLVVVPGRIRRRRRPETRAISVIGVASR